MEPRTAGPAAPGVDGTRDAPARSFDTLYRDELATMVRIAYLILGSREQAEEVAHDAFIRLHDRWDRVDNPRAYLRSCVVNGCRDIRRRLGRYREREHRLVGPSQSVDAPDELFDALARLPVRQRAVVVLRFYDGMGEQQVADTLGMKVGTVKSTLHRALHKLREELSDGG